MHKIDTSRKPVYIMHTMEPIMLADMQAIADAGSALIAAGQPFALVMVSDGGDSKQRARGANAALTQWVKANKPELERLCAGMASVVPTSALMAIYKPIMKTVGGPHVRLSVGNVHGPGAGLRVGAGQAERSFSPELSASRGGACRPVWSR
jgi:hypothetical protein